MAFDVENCQMERIERKKGEHMIGTKILLLRSESKIEKLKQWNILPSEIRRKCALTGIYRGLTMLNSQSIRLTEIEAQHAIVQDIMCVCGGESNC